MANEEIQTKHAAFPEQEIRTKIKFVRSEDTGAMIGFVSREPNTGWWRGVKQDSDYPKSICIVKPELGACMVHNVLYDCVLVKRKESNSFDVVEASPVKFEAHIESSYEKGRSYRVTVSFGNKRLRFDPFQGCKKSVRSFRTFRSELERRLDVKNLDQVLADFDETALTLIKLLRKDTKKRKLKFMKK